MLFLLKKALYSLLGKEFLFSTRVIQIQNIENQFCILTLQGEAIKKIRWHAGDKMKIRIGRGKERSYTPFDVDSKTGALKFVAFLHGKGEGSSFFSSLQKEDLCYLSQPRSSLPSIPEGKEIFFFGDETTFGVAAAIQKARNIPSSNCIFEVSSLSAARKLLSEIDLKDACLIEKKEGHLQEVGMLLLKKYQNVANPHLVLMGRAQSLVSVREFCKKEGDLPSCTLKSYWSVRKEIVSSLPS